MTKTAKLSAWNNRATRQQKKWKALTLYAFFSVNFQLFIVFSVFFLMQDLTLSFATCEFKLTIISNRVKSYIFSKNK